MWHPCLEGPRTPSKTTDANLDFALVENALVFDVPNIGRALAHLSPHFTTSLIRVSVVTFITSFSGRLPRGFLTFQHWLLVALLDKHVRRLRLSWTDITCLKMPVRVCCKWF